MYIQLDEFDARTLAIQSMLGIVKSEHIVRQAINASGDVGDDALLTLATLTTRARDLLNLKSPLISKSGFSEFGSSVIREAIIQSPVLISALQSYEKSNRAATGNTANVLRQNIQTGIFALRTSIEQARSVINYVDGKPFDLQVEQAHAIYADSSPDEMTMQEEEMTMRY